MARNMEFNLVAMASVGAAVAGLLNVAQGMKKTSEEFSKVEDNMKRLVVEKQTLEKEITKSGKIIERATEMKNKEQALNEEYERSVKYLEILKSKYVQQGQNSERLAKKIKEQTAQVEKLNKQKERQKHMFESARSSIEQEKKKLESYGKKVNDVSKELEKLNEVKQKQEKINNLKESVKNFSDSSLKFGTAITGSLYIPVKKFMEVEDAQSDLRKILGDEAQKYYKDLQEISKKSALSQPEIYEIAGALAQSGIQGEQIVDYTNKAQQLKIAFDMTTQEAGEFLAKSKEQLGLSKDEIFSFADTLNYMSDNTASSAAQLADFSMRIGGLAKTVGLSKEANVAFGATLISMGKAPEVAATGIKQLYLEISKGADSKKKMAAFSFLGLDGNKVAQDMAKDAEGTIIRVLERINNLNQADKASVINDLFGEQAIDSVSTLANQTEALRENLKKANSEMAKGSAAKEYENKMNTLSMKFKQLKNNFNTSLANLGASLVPALTPILQNMTEFIQKISAVIEKYPKITSTIMTMIGLFGALSLGIGGVLKVLSPAISLFAFLTQSVGETTRIISWLNNLKGVLGIVGTRFIKFVGIVKAGLSTITAFAMANPIIAIIGGIVLVGVALVVLYKKCEWFRNGVNKVFSFIKKFAINAWNGIKVYVISVFNSMKFIGNIAFKAISIYVRTYIKIITTIIKGLKIVFSTTWNAIKTVGLGVWKALANGWDKFTSGFKSTLTSIVDFFKNKWKAIVDTVKNNPISKGISWVADKVGMNADGTNSWRGGLTTVAEKGAELIKIPGKNPFIANSEMLLDLPRGTEIQSNHKTRNTLRDKVGSLKSKVRDIDKRGSSVNVGGDTITFNISGGNPLDIAKQIEKVLAEREKRKRRVAF